MRLRFQTDEGIAGFLGSLNEWYPFPEHQTNAQEICSGFQIKQPLFWFDEHRFVSTVQINHATINSDDLCNKKDMVDQFHPLVLYDEGRIQ
jgi:hypothetical protein